MGGGAALQDPQQQQHQEEQASPPRRRRAAAHRARTALRAQMKRLLRLTTTSLEESEQGTDTGRSQRHTLPWASFCHPDFIPRNEWPERKEGSFSLTVADIRGAVYVSAVSVTVTHIQPGALGRGQVNLCVHTISI